MADYRRARIAEADPLVDLPRILTTLKQVRLGSLTAHMPICNKSDSQD